MNVIFTPVVVQVGKTPLTRGVFFLLTTCSILNIFAFLPFF